MPPETTPRPGSLEQPVGEDAGALEGALLALAELGLAGELERDGLGGDDVLERAALLAGEDAGVQLLGEVLAGEDEAAAGPAEGLVRGRGDDVGVRDGGGVQARGDQPGEVGHVDHEPGADLVGDAAERGEVELARVGRPARDDQLRAALVGEAGDLVHVDPVVVRADVVGGDVVEPAREVQAHAVGEVAAVGEVEAQDGVARLEQRGHDGGVGLGAGVRLDVGELGAEEGLDPVDRELLDHVDVLAPAVVAPARVALGVLVGEHRALRGEDGRRREVLAGDHLQRPLLAGGLPPDRGVDLGVGLGQRPGQDLGSPESGPVGDGQRHRPAPHYFDD